MYNTSFQHAAHIRTLPYGHVQTLALQYTKTSIDETGRKAASTLSRIIEICFLGNKEGFNKYCVTCIKADFTHARQSDYLARLKLLIMEAFDTIVLSTDQCGMIRQIHNFGYLQQQWNKLRKEIFQDYDAEPHLQLAKDMDLLMQHEHKVVAFLQSPANYGMYFNGYKAINLSEKHHGHTALFGEEFSHKTIAEMLECNVTNTPAQQLVELIIRTPDNTIDYSGTCIYLDGALDRCYKEIKTEFFTLNYSVKWVGLKKSFLQ